MDDPTATVRRPVRQGRAEPTGDTLPVGHDVGQYRILSVLGHGGFGITYLVEHVRLKKHFAMKEYFPRQFGRRRGTTVEPSADSTNHFRWGLDRFLKEAEDVARFKHSAIVDVTDHFETNGTAYMVLAYEAGQSFGAWLAGLDRRPTQEELDAMVSPLLDAVAMLHSAEPPLLHRDIAPDNIIIRRDGSPLLIDFGAARTALGSRMQLPSDGDPRMTAIVKPGFSPPEQYTGESRLQGAWSDIYALGATLYRAVSGNRPVPAEERRAKPDVISAVRDGAGQGYRVSFLEAIDWALQLDPRRRPQSVAEWRGSLFAVTFGGLDGAFGGRPGRAAEGPRGHSSPTRGVSRTVLVAAPVALAALALVGFLAWPRPSPAPAPTTPPFQATTPEPVPAAIMVRVSLPKASFAVGEELRFTLEANRDCHFLVYTVSADDKVEVHDPASAPGLFGDPVLRAGERRDIPVAGSTQIARVKAPAGDYEVGAVCGRQELARLGLARDALAAPAQGGRRSFEVVLKEAVGRLRRDEISRASASYRVTQ